MGTNEIKYASCHPDRKHMAHGFCSPCYHSQHYKKNKAIFSLKAKKRYRLGGKEEWETYYTKNREHIVERQRLYREKNKAKINAKQKLNWSRYKYGISLEVIEEIRKAQDNKCAGCSRDFTELLYPCVDHCHTTNKIRGLLCDPCNKSLGILLDNVETLRRLADYLERNR